MNLTKPEWRAGVNKVLGASWTTWSVGLSASTTAPTGWTSTGHYYRTGSLIVARFLLTAGASMTAGSGTYRIALPVTADLNAVGGMAGDVWLSDASTGNAWAGQLLIADATYATARYAAGGAAGTVTSTAPWTWAASDTIGGLLVYESAVSD